MMEIISLNGTDNTGKTTHSKLLTFKNTPNVALIGSISNYNNRWKTDANRKERWTNNYNEEDFISLFVESILERNNAIEKLKNINIAILDRGLTMLESSIVANIQVKKGISKEKAQYLFNNFVEKHYGEIKNVEDASILLRYSDNIKENIDYTISNQDNNFSKEENERYRIYQKYLNENLIENLAKFDFLIKANTTIITTQNAIREALNHKFGYNMQLFGKNIETLYGIGGSSESGKSSFGEISRKEHNFINLKLKYFSEIIQKSHPNLSPDSEEFGLYMATEIDKFADAHYYFKKYSFESLRYPKSVQFFKKFRGEKFKSIFIDADKEIRIYRYANDNNITAIESIEKVAKKDEEKRNDGAFEIEKTSDYILYNNDSPQRRKQKIANFHMVNEYENNKSYEISSLDELKLPEEYDSTLENSINICKREFKDRLRLLVLSGSGGRQDIINDFSDLDLFLVVDNITNKEAQEFRFKYRFLNNIKIGYTVLDSSEMNKGNRDGKSLYTFRNIHIGEYPILYGDGIKIPKIDIETEKKLNKEDIPLYIDNTGKEIENASTDKETIEGIKHLHTIMKIILMIHGIQKEGYRQVHNSFYEKFKKFSFNRIPCIMDIYKEEKIQDKYRADSIVFIKNIKKSLEELIKV